MKNSVVSIYILAPLLGWLAAHVVKFGIGVVRGRFDLRIFFQSGSMPSSHTAVVVSLATVIGVCEGFGSALFGIVATFGAIVVFDALNVRRAVGEQGAVLKTLTKKSFFMAKGHTVAEVVVGAAIGVTIGYALLQIL